VKFLKPLLSLALAIFLPLAALVWYSNLPEPEPEIPASLKAQGVHGLLGERIEEVLLADKTLKLAGQDLVFACPTTLLASIDQPGLCGYCKVSDVVVYPSWQPGFTERLKPADFDFRSFYDDVLHKRYIMKTHTADKIFESAESNGWQASKGKWFTCRNESQLDVNAYVEVTYSEDAKSRFDYDLGAYDELGQVRPQPFVG
jgi:hypothetical protein